MEGVFSFFLEVKDVAGDIYFLVGEARQPDGEVGLVGPGPLNIRSVDRIIPAIFNQLNQRWQSAPSKFLHLDINTQTPRQPLSFFN